MTGPSFAPLILGGVLLPPIVGYALVAFVLFLLLRPLLHHARILQAFAWPALTEFGLFVAILGLIVLLH